MKSVIVAGMVLTTWMMLAGLASADGVGVCVAGQGAQFAGEFGTGAYAGVNVGQNSESGVYDNEAAFQTQCCAETGQAPDCFEPVG